MRASIAPVLTALALMAGFVACDQPAVQVGHGDPQSASCVSCHLPEYQSAAHHAGSKPTTCAVCHGSDAWHPTGLHHSWPLLGAHERTNCFDCHKGDSPVFKGTPKTCVGCHRDDFDKAPDHAGRFALTCEDCHSTVAWKSLVPSPKWPVAEPEPAPSALASAKGKPAPPPAQPKPAPTHSPIKPPPTPPWPSADVPSHASPRR